MSERPKINVHNLFELNELLEEYHWPAELIVPVQVFGVIFDRVQPAYRSSEYGSEFAMVSGVKIQPPKPPERTGRVDLSDAEIIDAE